MEIRAVKKQIQNKSLDKFYIFTGDEVEAQRIYIDKIAEVTERDVVCVDTIADAVKFKTGVLKIPRLFVVRDDKDFISKGAETDINELLGDKMLILQLTAVDKRTKFYKQFEERIVTFNYMSVDVLYKYVQRACKLSDSNTEQLINICGNDYSRILLEVDKVNSYAVAESVSVDTAFERLTADGTIYRAPEDAIFDFVDAVLQAKPNIAYRLLEDCRAFEEPSLKLISVLYSNMKRVLQVQTCSSKNVTEVTGLTAWDVKCVQKNLNCWDSRDLVYFLKRLQSIEKAIKTGEIDDAVAIDYALSQIF